MALPNNPTPAELVKEVKALDANKMDKANPTGTGSLSINRRANTTIGTNSVSIGNNNEASGDYSNAQGYRTRALGEKSHTEGSETVAVGSSSHAEGFGNDASTLLYLSGDAEATTFTNSSGVFPKVGECVKYNNIYAKVISIDTTNSTIKLDKKLSDSAIINEVCITYDAIAYANYSHVEGRGNTASGSNSHAEGYDTISSGSSSHAEGNNTVASGSSSHAEGNNTVASGSSSHAEGCGTTAQRKSQHVFGEYNIIDTNGSISSRGSYVEIIGNGTADNSRSNARTLDWSGNEKLAGWVTMNGNVEAVGYDLTGTSTAEQTLLDNYYTKTQGDGRYSLKNERKTVSKTGYSTSSSVPSFDNSANLLNLYAELDSSNNKTYCPTIGFVERNTSDSVLYMRNRDLYIASGGTTSDIPTANTGYKLVHEGNFLKVLKEKSGELTQLLSSQISGNANISLNGSITNYRYIIIGGCDQSNGGKSHVMLPTKLFTTNIDSAIKNQWNRLVVTTSEGYVGLWYVGETNGNSVFHIDGFSGSPNFGWLLVYGVN